MAERPNFAVTPLEARIALFNEIYAKPESIYNGEYYPGRGQYSEAVARALHGSLYAKYFNPNYRSLKPMGDAQRNQLFSDRIDTALNTLNDRESEVIKLRFGFDGTEIKNLGEVGREFEISDSKVGQIISHALRKLRHPSRSKHLKEFLP